jgi:hypothetical protein
MKKLLLLATAITITTVASAQFYYGAKAGVNLSKFSGSGTSDVSTKMKVGFHIGALAGYNIMDGLSVQPELLYSSEGSKQTQETDSWTDNLSYLNIPVLVKYKSSVGIYGEVGPQIGFLLSAKEKDASVSTNIKQYLNSTNFSLAFGLGYQSEYNIGIDARYNLGLSNLAKDAGSDGKIKCSTIQIGVFYILGGGSSKK